LSWDSEAKFVDDFVASTHLTRPTNNRRIRVWREVRTGHGRPDVLVVEYNPEALEHRLGDDDFSNPLSTAAAFAMAHLTTRRWISQEHLAYSLNCPERLLEGVLQELLRRRLIEGRHHLIKARPRADVLAVRNLWVFEAKLYQWRAAIQQAERHLWFTNDSYILP